MKSSRAIAGVTMILALLGLIAHQHDCDESHDDCPAVAWHSGAVQCASSQVALHSLPEQVVEFVSHSILPVVTQAPAFFRPRGPPSTVS
ncbi:MAG: hypothetical protein NTY01_08740 [Verrucomicrobia bacterium]|nr:hypothetical protein [Verrucomicrobiota bacterium]